MRCILCQKISWRHICSKCQKTLLQPTPSLRVLEEGFRVYSFYRYSEIAPLLLTKHTYIGAFVYRILAQNSFTPFARDFTPEFPLYALGIDDRPGSGYAHTAILARALQTSFIIPEYGRLRAQNSVRYAGKPLQFRQQHPRRFQCRIDRGKPVVLVDDIVTTGTTILEAKSALEKAGATPMFAITLADARDL